MEIYNLTSDDTHIMINSDTFPKESLRFRTETDHYGPKVHIYTLPGYDLYTGYVEQIKISGTQASNITQIITWLTDKIVF